MQKACFLMNVTPFLFQLYYQVLNFGMIVSSALMIWKGLMVVTGSESPIVVVLRWVSQTLKVHSAEEIRCVFDEI